MTVFVWLAFVEVLTSLPGSDLPTFPALPSWTDKVVHFCMYGMLGLLLARVGVLERWSRQRMVLTVVMVSVFGVLDELHQLFIPGRDAEVGDWVMDTLGSASGFTGLLWVAGTRWGAWLFP
ncbi:MAG: VanZ family protein [Gemmatimonadales bacterium]